MRQTDDVPAGTSPAMAKAQRLQAIFDNAVDFGILAIDRDGRVTDWNVGAERVLGWTAAEMQGQTIECIFTPEDRAEGRLAEEMRQALAQGRASDERWHMRADGARFWASGELMPLRDEQGACSGFVKILRDRTAEHEAGKTLRELEADLERAQVAGGVGVFTVDVSDNVLKTTPEFCRIFGLPVRDRMPPDMVERLVLPEHADLKSSRAKRVSGDVLSDVEYRIRRADNGEIRWLNRRSEIERDEHGTPVRFFGVVRDITDQRMATEARCTVEAERDAVAASLQALNETLEQRVAERTAELMMSEEQLRQSQKLEAVGQLTGGVAHDFNNLLTVIKSSVDLLKRPGISEERRTRYVAAISDTVDRAARLTGQLLAFARRQALRPVVFAACDSVRNLRDMMGTLTGSRVTITTDLPVEPCFVMADPSQFDTALVNLAVNAKDAMDGEGRITIAVRAVETIPVIRTHAAVEGPYVAISLSDTGSGIPAETIAHIFEPFFTTKEIGKGTGLGLSQVFGFAKQSGGDVTVESTPGEGTTFTLYLPRAVAPEQTAVTEQPGALVLKQRATVSRFRG